MALEPVARQKQKKLSGEQQFAEAFRTGDATKFGEKEVLHLKNLDSLCGKRPPPPKGEKYIDNEFSLAISYKDGFFLQTNTMLPGFDFVFSYYPRFDDVAVRAKVTADGKRLRKAFGKNLDDIAALKEVGMLDHVAGCSDFELGALYVTASATPVVYPIGMFPSNWQAWLKKANGDPSKLSDLIWLVKAGTVTREKIKNYLDNPDKSNIFLKLVYERLAKGVKGGNKMPPRGDPMDQRI